MKKIKLPRRIYALVDDEDYEAISSLSWSLHFDVRTDGTCKVYPRTSVYNGVGLSPTTILMNRLIMRAPKGTTVDHRNGNTLDNRKENLRVCTHQENNMNAQFFNTHKSANFKGVAKHSANGTRWRARIRHHGKLISIGNFNSPEDAARAYDARARELFGPFARVNFPESVDDQAADAMKNFSFKPAAKGDEPSPPA